MNFLQKKSMLLAARISTFFSIILTLIFAVVIVLFPDFLMSFSENLVWVGLLTDFRKFFVVWLFLSMAGQLACAVMFIKLFDMNEGRLKSMNWLYILSIVLTAVFGTFITLGIIIIPMLLNIKTARGEIIMEQEVKLRELKELKEAGLVTDDEFKIETEKYKK